MTRNDTPLTKAQVNMVVDELKPIMMKFGPDAAISGMASMIGSMICIMTPNRDKALDTLQELYLAMRNETILSGDEIRDKVRQMIGLSAGSH